MTDMRPEEQLLTSKAFDSTDRVNMEDLATTRAISKRLESFDDDHTYTRQHGTMTASRSAIALPGSKPIAQIAPISLCQEDGHFASTNVSVFQASFTISHHCQS
jgi:hypothetical protein